MNLAKLFPFRRAVGQPRLRLLCLPYAGGTASLYRQWPDGLPSAIEVCPVELPGRGVRLGEPPSSDLSRLCDDVIAAIDELPGLPMAVFGHSMGAKLAFELARRLDDRIVYLFASGSP